MKYSLTSGEVYDIPDMCEHCTMDTGGSHENYCPLSRPLPSDAIPDFLVRLTQQGLDDIAAGRIKVLRRGI